MSWRAEPPASRVIAKPTAAGICVDTWLKYRVKCPHDYAVDRPASGALDEELPALGPSADGQVDAHPGPGARAEPQPRLGGDLPRVCVQPQRAGAAPGGGALPDGVHR